MLAWPGIIITLALLQKFPGGFHSGRMLGKSHLDSLDSSEIYPQLRMGIENWLARFMIQSFSVSSCADGISKNLRFLHFEITRSSDHTYLVFVEEYVYRVPSYFRITLSYEDDCQPGCHLASID